MTQTSYTKDEKKVGGQRVQEARGSGAEEENIKSGKDAAVSKESGMRWELPR